jgi:type IV pilus assembly protein PilM
MAGFLSNLFGKKSSSVLGIDIGSSSIKVVQLSRRSGRAILETYGELALGPYAGSEIGRATNLPPEKISEALIDVIREAKVTSRNCGMAIPFGMSLISAIEMPALAEKQLAQMIPIEARKYIPVPIQEVMLDWILVPKPGESGTSFSANSERTPEKKNEKIDLLLVAIHNDTLARYQTIVKQASLNASFFEIEIFSSIRSVLDQDITNQMVIDMGAASTKVYIVERGIVRTSHVVNRGSQDITLAMSESLGIPVQQAEIIKRDISQVTEARRNDIDQIISLTLDYVFSEAHRTLLSYQKHFNKDISKVVMVGGGARLMNVRTLAETHFQTDVLLGDPFGKTEAPGISRESAPRNRPRIRRRSRHCSSKASGIAIKSNSGKLMHVFFLSLWYNGFIHGRSVSNIVHSQAADCPKNLRVQAP